MLEKAVRICDAKFGNIYRWDGDALHLMASYNTPAAFAEARGRSPNRPGPQTPAGRMIETKTFVHVPDLAAHPAYAKRDPWTVGGVELAGVRTLLVVPMVKEDELVGGFTIYRQEVHPLPRNRSRSCRISPLKPSSPSRTRGCSTSLRSQLEQQTATSEVLQVISWSPGELERVFTAMLANATRICEAQFGNFMLREGSTFRAVAWHGEPTYVEKLQREPLITISDDTRAPLARLIETKQPVHVADLRSEPAYKASSFAPLVTLIDSGGARTLLLVPMLKENTLVGAISIYRREVRPFSDKQIELVQNFANQAVIAIENTRLLNELRQRTTDLTKSLEQQTATSEVLQVISSAPGELEPVFSAMLEKAARISDAKFGGIYRWDGDALHLIAAHNTPPEFAEYRRRTPLRPDPKSPSGRMIAAKTVVHVADVTAEQAYTEHRVTATVAAVELGGVRTALLVPMLKENDVIGAFTLSRQEVRPFTDKQIALVTNFAAQAVIAIENARLLSELREFTTGADSFCGGAPSH